MGRLMPWSKLGAHAPSYTMPPHSGLRSAFPDSLLESLSPWLRKRDNGHVVNAAERSPVIEEERGTG